MIAFIFVAADNKKSSLSSNFFHIVTVKHIRMASTGMMKNLEIYKIEIIEDILFE